MLLSSSQEQTIALLTFVIWEKLHFTFCYDVIIYACQFNFFKWPQWCYTKYIKVSFESDELRGEVLTVFFSAVASINASKWVNPKGNQTWTFIGRTDAEAEALILWPPDAKSWLIRKDSDTGESWRPEEKGTIEDKMVGWHHQLNRHEFEQTLGDGEGQGSLACCSPWGHKESDMTEWLNNKKKTAFLINTVWYWCIQRQTDQWMRNRCKDIQYMKKPSSEITKANVEF